MKKRKKSKNNTNHNKNNLIRRTRMRTGEVNVGVVVLVRSDEAAV